MKTFLKSAIADCVALLPWGAREEIKNRLVETNGRYEFFAELAQAFNVETLQVRGKYGSIQSGPNDLSILQTYARTGVWAERTNSIVREFFLKHGEGTYIDIGANIGLTTIPIAANAKVSCLAIEPEPRNYQNLVANVARNCSHGNVQTISVAVFSKRTKVNFELASANLGDHRLRMMDSKVNELGESERPVITVDALPLDDIAPAKLGKLAIKMDVQGAEPFVFEGGPRTLGQADLIVMEFWPYSMARMGADPEIALTFLREKFSHLSLAESEVDVPSRPRPVEEALSTLRAFFRSNSETRSRYLDIIAEK